MKYKELHFPEAPKIVVKPPGPKAKEILELQKKLEGKAVLYPHSIPLVPDEAKGATIRDVDGNVYIDFFSGISVLNFGHSNPKILEAAIDQMKKLTHTLDFPTVARVELVKRINEILPERLRGKVRVIFGGPTGSDAVEAAIKLVKYFTRRFIVIAFEGSYHGQTTMALSVTSSKRFKEAYSPLGPEVHFVPYAYCYRCVFGLEYPECKFRCVEYLRHVLEDPYSGVPAPAGIIVEPIQGESGIVVPPPGFLKEVEKVAREFNIPLIVDEIQAGLGRTGKWFAFEHDDVTPDIIVLAKSLGGIGLPLSCIVYREELDVWHPGAHAGTFRGNVVAMIAGAKAIDFARETNLLDHVRKLGEESLKFLKDMAEESKIIGEARGKGLMLAIELVEDKESKKPAKELTAKIQLECFKRGVIVWKAGRYGNVIRLLPPLVITEELMMKGLEILRDVVKTVEGTVKK